MARLWHPALIALLAISHELGQAQLHPTFVSGSVLAANDSTELYGARVSAWAGGKVIGETTTDSMGRYELRVNTPIPIDAIYYEYTGWPTQQVQQLSGSRDHVINKLLQPIRSQLPLLPALGTLAAYESLYFISNHGENLDIGTRNRAREVLQRLEVPPPILARLQEVQALWGVRRGD